VILDPNVLADLAVAITPKSYVRVTPMTHAATPLGAGFGVTRFASPTKAFKVIYIAQDLATGIAETLVRDRFQGRARRKLLDVEAALWGMAEQAVLMYSTVALDAAGIGLVFPILQRLIQDVTHTPRVAPYVGWMCGSHLRHSDPLLSIASPFPRGYLDLSALFVRGAPSQRLDNGTAASLSPNGTTSALS
jgi:hypothetical protein